MYSIRESRDLSLVYYKKIYIFIANILSVLNFYIFLFYWPILSVIYNFSHNLYVESI